MATKNYIYPQFGKRIKSISGLTRYLNACTSLPSRIQPDWDSPMLAENNDVSNYFIYHEEEEYPLGNEKQNVEEDQSALVGKCSDNENVRDILPGHTPQDGLHIS